MAKSKQTKLRYMLIDGNALVHRGFHALPPMHTKDGEQTNAVYGFTMILLKAMKDIKPTHIACTFDLAAPTFRHEKYKDYKATRVKAANELYVQIPRVKEVVRALNIPIFEKSGFEADDLLGTLATHICRGHGDSHRHGDVEVMVVTGDLDTLQLVNNCVQVYTLRKGLGDTAVYDEAAVKARYGLAPGQLIDFRALRGDPSDNIKGVHGIGEKTAAELIQHFGSLKDLYHAVKSNKADKLIKPRVLELLKAHEEDAKLSRELSEIVCDVPIKAEIEPYFFAAKNLKNTVELFQELQFHSLIAKLPRQQYPESSIQNQAEDNTKTDKPLHHHNKDQHYMLIDTEDGLEKFIQTLAKHEEIALDTETTSLEAVRAELVGVSLSTEPGHGHYIPAELALANKELHNILEKYAAKKIGHNIKYDLLVLENEGIKLSGIYFDTMIASYLLNAGTRQHNLNTLAFNELGYQMQPIEELIGKGKKQISMSEVPVEKVSWYACEDVDITLQLKKLYEPQLVREGLYKIFEDIEMPLVEVLANMERNGIKLDVKFLGNLSKKAAKEINKLESSIHRSAKTTFNINSPKQLKEVLFEQLGLVSPDNKKTKTGLSTAAEELEKMRGQHPVVEKVLEYRELSKLQSTYLEALPLLVNPDTERIHTSFNQTVAATGRLSSSDPNLQNIPVRGVGIGSEVRKAFVAEKGYKLLSLDYSQIELRIIAHLSQDKNMLEVFNKREDIHTNTAMEIFGVSANKVTPDMRRDAKTINFGILYGLSFFGLSSRIGEVSRSDAKTFIDKYFAAYPNIKVYIEQIKEEAHKQGYVRNELGRIRKFPEIKSSQFAVRAAAERAAVNFPIQSLAADVIKVAMVNIYKETREQNEEIRMLLQVHDELVFEVKAGVVEKWAKNIKPMMEEAIALSVPVKAEAKVGDNWGEMKKLEK